MRRAAEFYMYPMPEVAVADLGPRCVEASKKDFLLKHPGHKIVGVSVVHSEHHPEFGTAMPALRVEIFGERRRRG